MCIRLDPTVPNGRCRGEGRCPNEKAPFLSTTNPTSSNAPCANWTNWFWLSRECGARQGPESESAHPSGTDTSLFSLPKLLIALERSIECALCTFEPDVSVKDSEFCHESVVKTAVHGVSP